MTQPSWAWLSSAYILQNFLRREEEKSTHSWHQQKATGGNLVVVSTAKRMKRQATKWEKYLQNTYLIKNMSKIYKDFLEFNSKRKNNPIKEMDKRLNTSLKKIHR